MYPRKNARVRVEKATEHQRVKNKMLFKIKGEKTCRTRVKSKRKVKKNKPENGSERIENAGVTHNSSKHINLLLLLSLNFIISYDFWADSSDFFS